FLLQPETAGRSALYSTIPFLAIGTLLLFGRIEGAVCLVMVLPLALPLFWIGAAIAFYFRTAAPQHRNVALLILILLSPASVAAEAVWPWDAPVFSVTSSIEVDAPPEAVWKHVVSFSELPEEREWLFHSGVAYPLRAEITGTGPGAVRKCVF